MTQRLDELIAEGLDVDGMVCHVGEAKHRQVRNFFIFILDEILKNRHLIILNLNGCD